MTEWKPHELILALMDQARPKIDGPSALERAIKVRGSQPRLSRFLNGKVAEPNRDLVLALARRFDIPTDALYDVPVATKVATERGLTKGAAPRALPVTYGSPEVMLSAFSDAQLEHALSERRQARKIRQLASNKEELVGTGRSEGDFEYQAPKNKPTPVPEIVPTDTPQKRKKGGR